MPIGPLAIAIVRGILPYNTTDSNTALAAKVAAHQGAETAVIWLTFVALLTLIPGVIAVGHARQAPCPAARHGRAGAGVRRRSHEPVLVDASAGSDNVALAAARVGLPPALPGAAADQHRRTIPSRRAGREPSSCSATSSASCCSASRCGADASSPPGRRCCSAASQVLHFVFAVIVPVHALDGCAWGLTAVGFAAAAVALAREPIPCQG